jgi:hypothetical protein
MPSEMLADPFLPAPLDRQATSLDACPRQGPPGSRKPESTSIHIDITSPPIISYGSVLRGTITFESPLRHSAVALASIPFQSPSDMFCVEAASLFTPAIGTRRTGK